MKKLIFGLSVFITSVLGILCSIGFELSGKYIYATTAHFPHAAMEMTGYCLFAFVVTAAIGFIIALIGAFAREKSNK